MMRSNLMFCCSSFLAGCLMLGCSSGDKPTGGNDTGTQPDQSALQAENTTPDDATGQPPNEVPQPEYKLRRDGNNLAMLFWNADSSDSDPATVLRGLTTRGQYHIYGLTEVNQPDEFSDGIKDKWPDNYDSFYSESGAIEGAMNNHSVIIYDYNRMYLVSKDELVEFRGTPLSADGHPAPLVAHLRDKERDDEEFLLVVCHLSEDPEFRQNQVEGLSAWAKTKSQPIYLVGNFRFARLIDKDQGDESFHRMTGEGTWRWVRPVDLLATEYRDEDGDDLNDLENQVRDHIFAAGRAVSWPTTCQIKKRSRDFPDDQTTSNHRPIELIVDPQ